MSMLGMSDELGLFEGHSDIGALKLHGSAGYDPASQQYTLRGAGKNMWLDNDEFHMLYRRIKGDFILRAHVRFVGKGVDPHRKIGCIVRSSLDGRSAYADAAIHGDGLTSLQFRRASGALTEEIKSPIVAPDMVQLSRVGEKITMSVAFFGEPFGEERSLELPLGDEVYVGLFITSHNAEVIEQAVFSEVRLVLPATKAMVPYRDYLGSNLEIMDLEGKSRIIYRTPEGIEAPNWTRDGKSLIYNSKGRLFRFDLATGTPTAIDTGEATGNNNDHVLSFDGQMLGISSNHDARAGRKSMVYVVPTAGGTPRQITTKAPSYLHGWSPDGKTLIYTGERGDGNYDIYSIPVSGGEETRLTTAPGLDDGSEFTPDGKYIYFNSVRSGLMQIWHMRPDGSHQQQVTDDRFNNWFPHISPDGKWIAFLSYGQDVAAGDHPYYKHVLLRLMPFAGGAPRVLGYLYGGQGTINVPSWSPDSRRFAYVSHTGI